MLLQATAASIPYLAMASRVLMSPTLIVSTECGSRSQQISARTRLVLPVFREQISRSQYQSPVRNQGSTQEKIKPSSYPSASQPFILDSKGHQQESDVILGLPCLALHIVFTSDDGWRSQALISGRASCSG